MEKVITYTIEKEEELKIESVLKNTLNLSGTLISRLKRQEGAVSLNGKDVRLIERVKKGDLLKIVVSEKRSEKIAPAEIPLDILFEDGDVLVINKPRSMPIHPVRNHRDDTLANGVANYLSTACIHIITRLDKDTSGVVLIAKNPVSATFLTEEMKRGRIEKEYVAVIDGVLNPENGKIDAPIKRKSEKGIARCVSLDGKEAVTLYETIKSDGNYSLVKLCPVTGRTHQLRVHMSYMNCPIYGDGMYGASEKGRTLLHCKKLCFLHPETKEKFMVEAPIPEDIEKAM